ncbi:MAG: 7TM diverse intracellular signaling domain-containing protein [Chitinophagales bacterium]
MKTATRFIILFVFASMCLLPYKAQSQDSLTTIYTDISRIHYFKNITKNVSGAYISKNTSLEKSYASLYFTPKTISKNFIPNNNVTKKIILKFNLCNASDSAASIWFFPGYFYWDIHLYRLQENKPLELPSVLPEKPDSIGYRYISLSPHDTVTFLAELIMVKTYINSINPRLVNPVYLDSFISDLHSRDKSGDTVTYVFCGLLLMMILFSLANFLQGGNNEFLYYSGYAFFLGLMLFAKALLNFHATKSNYFLEGYLDFVMQGVGIMFYIIFMQRFLETKSKYRFLFHFYNAGVILLTFSLLSYSYSHYFSDNFSLENVIENLTKLFLLLMVIIFLVYSFRRWSNQLLRYLFWGNLCLFVFSMISQASITFPVVFSKLPGIFSSSLFYYEFGLFLELFFFLLGLSYKNRSRIIEETKERERLKAENQMKEYEKELAVLKAQQEERERISADMHDELGSGVTAIRLMSEIAKNKMKENTPVEIEKISASANDVLNKMNAIIWSMNSSNDTIDNLISYIRTYALEYFDGTPIHCTVNMPDNIPLRELTGDKRRNIFLAVKETLNNSLKHSKATEIKIDIETNNSLVIRIADNGVGIDMQNLRKFGNGLKNISRRMEIIGGSFNIENNKGTITTLQLPL